MSGDVGSQEIGARDVGANTTPPVEPEHKGFRAPEVTGDTEAQSLAWEASDDSAKGGPDPRRKSSGGDTTQRSEEEVKQDLRATGATVNPEAAVGAHDAATSLGKDAGTPSTTEVDQAAAQINNPGRISRFISNVKARITGSGGPPTATPQKPVATTGQS